MAYPIASAQYLIDRDLRVKAPGGLSYTASTDATDIAPLSGGDHSTVWVGIPSDGAFCLVKNALGNATGFSVISGTIHTLVDGVSDDTGIAAPTRLTEFQVDFTASTGEYAFYVARVLVFTSAGGDSAPAYTKRDGWTDAFTGSNLLSRSVNLVPTTDEAEGAAKGESRGRLARRGYDATNTTFNATGGNTTSGASASGITLTSGAGGGFLGTDISTEGATAISGRSYRIVGTMTGSVSAISLQVVIFAPGASVPLSVVIANGTVSESFVWPVLGGAFASAEVRFAGISSADDGMSISGFKLVAEGTVANYAPENVTSLNRWLDASGNNYHLLPVGGAKALNPQPVQVRTEEFRYDLGTSTASDSPQDWTLVKTGTGVMTATPASYIYGIKPPVCSAGSETVNHVTTAATNQSTGVVTISNTLATVATDAVIQGVLTHRE